MEVEVEVEDTIVAAVEALPAAMQSMIKDLMGQLGKEGKDYMDGLTPVRSGFLKSRNQVEVEDLDFTLSNDAPYAQYVELGTRFMHAQPFFYPTVEYLSGEMETVLAEALTP